MSIESHMVKQTVRESAQEDRPTHQSLARGLRILETVASGPGITSLAETARRTGLHRSTAHHLLQTLVGLGYLRQDLQTRGYEPAAKLFRLVGRTWTPEQLGEVGRPFVAELTARGHEGSSLAVYSNGIVTIVCKHDPDSPVRVVQSVGTRRAIHATAVGKAILAWLPQPEIEEILDRGSFERFTSRTLVTRAQLEREIARIRADGVAYDDEEHIEGIRCVAAPVFGYSGRVLASLCTLGPKHRMTTPRLRALRLPLQALARALSERLGWRAEKGSESFFHEK